MEGTQPVTTMTDGTDSSRVRALFRLALEENDRRILGPELDHGRGLVEERTALHSRQVAAWAADRQRAFGYDRPFAVVALGGTGRREVTPASDLDYALLFDDALEGNGFLLSLQDELLHTGRFEEQFGFRWQALPFQLEDAPRLAEKQLNSFLDLQPVHDPTGLTPRFRERIRATYDAFEHFLHVRGFWQDRWEKAAGQTERLDRFDIKNDGLRVFLAGIWTWAGKGFESSHDVYARLEDPRDLAAYEFLLRIRCFVHLRRARSGEVRRGGDDSPDVLHFDDFLAFGEMLGPGATERERFEFANEVRARLLAARRRVARFAKAVIERELREGRSAMPGGRVVYGLGGLTHAALPASATDEERSGAALTLVLAAQRYGVPIDPTELQRTFRQAGDWLKPVPELTALLYEERGNLADSFGFLSQFEGAEDRLFPGYARFEASLDARVMAEGRSLRSGLEREKLRTLEGMVADGRRKLAEAVSPGRLTDVLRTIDPAVEAALLDADHLAAVKLALKTKRLPLTAEDLRARDDARLPLYERYSSGMSDIPLAEYYRPYCLRCRLPEEVARLTESLIANRRAFKEYAETPNDAIQVEDFARRCGDAGFLRALFVFTCADRAHWESERDDPARWFNSRELYSKTLVRFCPIQRPADRIHLLGCPEEDAEVLRDFGEDFWAGEYRQYATVFVSALRAMMESGSATAAKAVLLSRGTSPILGIAARDYRGLAASITGALWGAGVDLRQAHLFSAGRHGLALDFFHLTPNGQPWGRELLRTIEEAVRERRHIPHEAPPDLPRLAGRLSLTQWRPGLYRLRYETGQNAGGLVYALSYLVYRHLGGNIFGLVAHAVRGGAFVTVYHSLPPGLELDRAQAIVTQRFC